MSAVANGLLRLVLTCIKSEYRGQQAVAPNFENKANLRSCSSLTIVPSGRFLSMASCEVSRATKTPPPGLDGSFLNCKPLKGGFTLTPPVGFKAGASGGWAGPCVASYKRDMISAVCAEIALAYIRDNDESTSRTNLAPCRHMLLRDGCLPASNAVAKLPQLRHGVLVLPSCVRMILLRFRASH